MMEKKPPTRRERDIINKVKDGWCLIAEPNFIALEHPKGKIFDKLTVSTFNKLYIKGIIYIDRKTDYYAVDTRYFN